MTNPQVIAYLVNQYPKLSHSFIRREIAALEAQGLNVMRYSIRAAGSPGVAGQHHELMDPADLAEAQRTRALLNAGISGLLIALGRMIVVQPGRFFTALKQTWNLARRGDAGVVRHLAYLAEACVLARWLEQAEAIHLHAHFGTNSASVAMLVHALTDLPYSLTVHGSEEFDKPVALSLKAKIEHATFVVAVSSFGRSQLYRWCGHDHWSKIHVVHCGLDATFLPPPSGEVRSENQQAPLPSGEVEGRKQQQVVTGSNPASILPRFVCAGRLCEQKGHLLLIEAVHRLIDSGKRFELILVGDGDMRPHIEVLMKRYHLEQVVTITGWQSGKEVIEHLRGARAMVLPSFAEGLPVVIMEALALGVPVISTYIGGIPELVTPECGWLVPAGSVEDLVEAMRRALDASTTELATMGRVGVQRVGERHAIHIEAGKLAALMSNR